MRPVVLDCTELFHNPVRTGVQRVVRELIRHWPSDGPELLVTHFVPNTPNGLALLSRASVDLLTERDARARSLAPPEISSRARHIEAEAKPPSIPDDVSFLVPEVFFDRHRSDFYLWLSETRRDAMFIICYDFLPFLRPELFNIKTLVRHMEYIRVLRAFQHTAHISHRTQAEFQGIIGRNGVAAAGVVLPLGADAVDLKKQSFDHKRQEFVSVGSIDGRKRQRIIADAFRLLHQRGHRVNLTLIGRAFEREDVSWLQETAKLPGFRWIADASDDVIADAYRRARATIYISEAEGFGLPPVESLRAGIPVIVASDMPCLADIAPLGQIRLSTVNPDTVAAAMVSVMDRATGAQIWSDAARLDLPTWRDFSRRTVDWIRTR